MREGWKKRKLGEVCETTSGGTPSKSKVEYYENGNIPWLRSGEVDRKYIDTTELFITELGLKNSSAKWFPVNTVVIAMYGATVGQVGILKKEMTTNQAICGIFPNDLLCPAFLYYFFITQRDNYLRIATGGAQPNISQTIIKNTYIPFPSLSEQQHIVSELDCLNGIIEKKKEQLKQLDELAQSVFYDMFGELVPAKPLSEYINFLQSGKSLAGEEVCKNKVLKTSSVSYGHFKKQEFKYLPKEYNPSIEHKVNHGDLIISRMNTLELVGSCAYVWEIEENTYLPDRLWKAILRKDRINAIFLWFVLNQAEIKEQIRNNSSGTSGSMKNISKPSFLKVKIPTIALDLQQQFASKITAIEQQKKLIKQSLTETETLFNSRMDYYFG